MIEIIFSCTDFGHAIGVKDVDIAIIIEVGETGAPAPGTVTHKGGVRDIGEHSTAVVFVQPVACNTALIVFVSATEKDTRSCACRQR